jgi:hypothetical protein
MKKYYKSKVGYDSPLTINNLTNALINQLTTQQLLRLERLERFHRFD